MSAAQPRPLRWTLFILAVAWAIYCFFLALYGPGDLFQLWATKFAVGLFGLIASIVAVRRRWQPWILASALAFLILHLLVWWAFLSPTPPDDESILSAVGSSVVTRWEIVKYFASTGKMADAARFFDEGLLMPFLQLGAAILSLAMWRAMPSNTTVETDAQRAARGSL